MTNLETAFAQELVASTKRDLDDGAELRHLACDVVLNVRDTLKVRNKLFDDGLPRGEAFDEDVGGAEVVRGDVLLDERLAAGDGRTMSARSASRAGDGGCA